MTKSHKPYSNKANVVLHSLLLVCALIAAWLLWARGQPERLLELDVAVPDFALSSETLFRTAYQDRWQETGPRIIARHIRGGPEQVVLEENPQYRFDAPDCFTVRNRTIYYAISPPNKNENGASRGPLTYLEYMHVTHPPALLLSTGRGVRVGLVQQPNGPPVHEFHFRSASIDGGAPHELVTIKGRGVCLVGDHVFWTRPARKESQRRPQVHQDSGEDFRHSDLMITSITDGTTRLLRTGVPNDTFLAVGETGIFWFEPIPFSKTSSNLFFCRADDGIPRQVSTVEPDRTVRWSAEHQGHLYWFEANYSYVTESQPGALMRANLDGSDVQEVVSLEGLHRGFIPGRNLKSYGGALYCLLTDRLTGSADESQPPVCLCRLDPKRPQQIEVVRKLPARTGGFRFEDGYLYFLTWGVNHATVTSTLCRVPLAP